MIKFGMRPTAEIFLALVMLGGSFEAKADTGISKISGTVSLELQSDWAFHSQDPDEERHDTFATIEAAIALSVTPHFKAKSLFVFEPVLDPGPGEDRFFGDMGLYAQELYGEYDHDRFAVRAGKFGQKFGIAWDVAPGIWGADFADYELDEQIGLAAEFRFGGKKTGKHSLTVGSFFTDTTLLSESAITNRGRTHKSHGGPGNTEDFSSISVAVEGSEIPALPSLRYHLAYLYRDSEEPGRTGEVGYAIGAAMTFKWGKAEITPLVEWARLNNGDGTPGTDVEFLTAAAELTRGPYSLVLVRTERRTSTSGMPDQDDHFTELSLGYRFEIGVKVSAGWRHTEVANIPTDTLGILIERELKF